MLGNSSRKKRDHQESQYRVGFYFCNLTSNLCNPSPLLELAVTS